jgi:hypothetical protein
MAACLLLLLLIVGVGSVMAFVFGGATPAALVVGAVLVVMSSTGSVASTQASPTSARPTTGARRSS